MINDMTNESVVSTLGLKYPILDIESVEELFADLDRELDRRADEMSANGIEIETNA